MSRLPRLAMVSTGIRRDLLAPLVYFKQFDLLHFYRRADYGDLTREDLTPNLIHYTSPISLYRDLVASAPDLVQSVEPFSTATQPYLWAIFLAVQRIRARLMVVSFENRPLDVKFGFPRREFFRKALPSFLRAACLSIAVNRGAYENLIECGAPPRRIERALWGSWGVDVDEFLPNPRARNDGTPTILFAGRIHKEKGVLVLADAFVLLKQAVPNVQLLVAGAGPAAKEFEARLRMGGVWDSVRLLGSVKHREMPKVFSRATVLAAPSLTTRKWAEQVGMSALQAMACGIPVVSTRSGAIPEYIPDQYVGFLVKENDPAALASALARVLQDTELAAQFGRNAREYVCWHYDAKKNVAKGERLVKEHCFEGRV